MTGTPDSWAWPGPLVKISDTGAAMLVDCLADGTAVERSIRSWDDPWHGRWIWSAGVLTIRIGDYELHVPDGSHRGREVRTHYWWSEPQDFYVFRAEERQPVPAGAAVLKVHEFGVHAAMLEDEGRVAEFDLLAGSDAGLWGGTWSSDPDLAVQVASYEWTAERHLGPGCYEGLETGAQWGPSRFPVVAVQLDSEQTRSPLSRRNTPEWLFHTNGYDFFRMDDEVRPGFFAHALEVRRASTMGAEMKFVAKVIRPEEEESARREIALSQRFSAADGLISVFEHFKLPDDPAFGSFAGSSVQILEYGETDLHRYLQRSAPLRIREVLPMVRDLASSLDSLHTKFEYVHSDVRPMNVIGRRTGDVLTWKLADFNTSSPLTEGRAPYIGGAISCHSPSLAKRLREERTAWTEGADDMWAFGLLVVQCFTGPLQLDRPVLPQEVPELIQKCPALIWPMLEGCMAPDPHRRWSARRARTEAARLEADATPVLDRRFPPTLRLGPR